MNITSTDGTAIECTRGGHGPPLVLVHGTTADHTRWAPILAVLEERFTVYAMDRRGRGRSGDSADYSIEQEFDDVAAVVDSIGEPVALLGHSYGALCSLEAARRTIGVHKLVLYEPPIPAGLPLYSRALIERMQSMLDRGDMEGVVTTFFVEVVKVPDGELKTIQSLPNWPLRVAAAHTIPRELRAAEAYRFDPEPFRSFAVPTLLLLGGDSPPFFKAAIGAVHAALSSSRVVVMPGQQHMAINTAPALLLEAVLTFLSD